ncbi:MAG TPA: hypothetical protein VIY72_07315 [Acidimicrobiales bacterium]
MINGDQAQPQTRPEPECAICHNHGWIDDRTTATPFVRPCPGEAHHQNLVSAGR